MPGSSNARRRKPAPPTELPLTSERDNREALTFMRVGEEITLKPEDRFAIVPGPKGHGWSIFIQRDLPAPD